MPQRRDLVVVCLGSLVSQFGDALTLIALLLTLRTAGSAATAGLWIAASVPVFLSAPLVGMLVDRLPNRRLMMAAEVMQAAAIVGIVAFQHNLVLIYAFLAVLGFAAPSRDPPHRRSYR
jgi:MFS family permease